MNEQRQQNFPGCYACVADICSFCAQAARDLGLSERAVFHVQMAVDEAVTNVIEHAYGGEDRGDIQVVCDLTDQALEITLIDHGRSFHPDTVPAPDLAGDLASREIGGLGLYFMRQMMDEVRFEFDSVRGNRLTMVKRLQPPEKAQA